ncbi:MAG: HDIG domain-containing protein [Deltaproteobacteria bacterium]|nr:HDIG domain-containing protein [Deltaproteobacteria bacterium]
MLLYENALNLLEQYGKGESWIQHCLAVAKLATVFSEILANKTDIDTEFLRSAALLHDIGRYVTHDPILHGVEGYKLLIGLQHHKEAFVCASHILYGLSSREAVRYGLPEKDFIPVSFEEKLIPLIDFMVEFDKPTTLSDRFTSLRQRNFGNNYFLTKLVKAEATAGSFLLEIKEKFDISLEDVALRAHLQQN